MKKPAFTLIELLVVIVIIGILATIGIAQFNDYQERARFAKAQAFAVQADTVLMAETVSTGFGFPLRLDFEEGSGTIAKDSSGSGNDLDLAASNVNNWGTGSPDSLDWSNDTPDSSQSSLETISTHVTISNVENMPESEISFSTFIKLDNFPNTVTWPVYTHCHTGIGVDTDGKAIFYIHHQDDKIESDSNKIQLNRWHHLLGSYKDGKMRFFVDGSLVGDMETVLDYPFNVKSPDCGSSTSLNIGLGYNYELDEQFNGKIDRVRIYPVGLDPSNL
jgi:prepilin-type N-terminal cleavage/methylation domain-containing protein